MRYLMKVASTSYLNKMSTLAQLIRSDDPADIPAINPLYFNVKTPDVLDPADPTFVMQFCNETLWEWRKHLSRFTARTVISWSLEKCLLSIGYELHSHATQCIVKILHPRLSSFLRSLSGIKDQRMRKSRRSEWFEIVVHPSEIAAGPVEIIAKIAEEGQQAEHQCQELFRVLAEAEQLKQRLNILERLWSRSPQKAVQRHWSQTKEKTPETNRVRS